MSLSLSYIGAARRHLRRFHIALRRRNTATAHISILCQNTGFTLEQLQADLKVTILHMGFLASLPQIENRGQLIPRVLSIASRFFSGQTSNCAVPSFVAYVRGSSFHGDLRSSEISSVRLAVRVYLLLQLTPTPLAKYQSSRDYLNVLTPSIAINFLKLLRLPEWSDFHQSLNPVEQFLLSDPPQLYERMDARSKALYRERVAQHATALKCSEPTIAAIALELARSSSKALHGRSTPQCHIGHYIMGSGQQKLWQGISGSPRSRFSIVLSRKHIPGAMRLASTCCALAAMTVATRASVATLAEVIQLAGISVPLAFLFIRMTSSLTTAAMQAFSAPSILPRLLLPNGLPQGADTLIAMPCLLVSREQVSRALENLAKQFTAASDVRVRCALLTDHDDSREPADDTPETQALLTFCKARLDVLNAQHTKTEDQKSFLLLHRRQVYAPRQGRWMGWERKRGKLEELNQLLTGQASGIQVLVGSLESLRQIRYVLVVDEDTRFAQGTIEALMGTMLHPLNIPILDDTGNRLTSGYGILQPALVDVCRCGTKQRQSRLAWSEPPIASRNRVHRDFYQDVYGATTFRGKGLYDVAVFSALAGKRLPSDVILSHDTVEGILVRTGFVPVVFEQACTNNFAASASRSHRWMRGNWQNLLYLFLALGKAHTEFRQQPCSYPFRWILVHKCLRGFDDVALVLALTIAVLSRETSPVNLCSTLVLFLEAVPLFIILRRGSQRLLLERLPTVISEVLLAIARLQKRTAVRIALSGVYATLTLDAASAAAIRMLTGRNTLDWETSAKAEILSASNRIWKQAIVIATAFAFSLWLVCQLLQVHTLFTSCVCLLWLIGSLVLEPALDGTSLQQTR